MQNFRHFDCNLIEINGRMIEFDVATFWKYGRIIQIIQFSLFVSAWLKRRSLVCFPLSLSN